MIYIGIHQKEYWKNNFKHIYLLHNDIIKKMTNQGQRKKKKKTLMILNRICLIRDQKQLREKHNMIIEKYE
jgi:hypothetical protein